MLKGGVIMDVVDADQARIAEDAGACAVMALERVPADIRGEGGVARMSDPQMIREIQEAVSIPVMAKCRIGHFVEAQILQALEVDYIDESEVLTPADVLHHVDKHAFTVPFVCGATNLGEALRRIAEGAAMIRTKGEAGTGDIVNAVTHMRAVFGGIRAAAVAARGGALRRGEGATRTPRAGPLGGRARPPPGGQVHRRGIATPADAALCMQLGADGVFVGSGIFKSGRDRDVTTTAGPRTSRAARGDRRGDDALRRPEDPRGCLDGAGPAHGRDRRGSLAEAERLELRGW